MLRNYLTTTGFALAIGLGLIGLGFGAANAQALRNADQPAEFPPASFTGKQYIDSKGCAFVRAGFDGAVTWVPRVSRQRSVMCGFQPTFARDVAPMPAPAAEPAPAPRVATSPVTEPAATPTKPAAAPSQTATVTPAPAQSPTPAPRATAPKAKVRVATAPAKPVRRAPPPLIIRVPEAEPTYTGPTSCPNVSARAQPYINTSHRVRCGPQGTPTSTRRVTAATPAPARAVPPAPARVLRVTPAPEIAPPPGYRAAFDDGRFNPNRGLQTREGYAQMRLIWTNGVPRRLVDLNTGYDVTRRYPGLRFPFIDLNQQKKYVAVHGWPGESTPEQRGVVMSTKNTPATAPVRAPAATAPAHRYVQVGTFANPQNAQNSAARLKAMGLPVRVGTYKKRGTTYRIVLAGPFNSAAGLQAGLSTARRAGFGDAFTRK
ncbi:MAG: SPOR domain-containing protein [Rhodobacter sp.]|nr:SPOR domain-containing protein [Rhodobacter sp.]